MGSEGGVNSGPGADMIVWEISDPEKLEKIDFFLRKTG